MKPQLNQKYLITTSEFFIAPNGEYYKAVFGTVKAIQTDKESLGIQTNRHATNWYLHIGNMIIGGCQIHYAIKTEECNLNRGNKIDVKYEGTLTERKSSTPLIYNADQD